MRSSHRRAHTNSALKIARPMAIVTMPGAGSSSMAAPAASRVKPTTIFATRLACVSVVIHMITYVPGYRASPMPEVDAFFSRAERGNDDERPTLLHAQLYPTLNVAKVGRLSAA